MKKLNKFFTYVMMAVMMVFTGFATFGGVKVKKASALVPGYIHTSNSIYYFCDLYPSIDYDTLQSDYGTNMNIILDRQNVNNDEFEALIDSGYFSGVAPDSIFVLDIKTFKPDSTVVSNLISNLRQVDGCKVVLVLPDTSDYSANQVEVLCETNLSRMETFVKNSLLYMNGGVPSDYRNLKILVDPNFINASSYYIENMLEESPFVGFLLGTLGVINDDDVSQALNILNIEISLCEGNGEYIDLFGSGVDESATRETYAMGCWSLDSDFYNDLYAKQTNSELSLTFMMEGNPIVYGSSGLRIMDEWDLASAYGTEENESTQLASLMSSTFGF